MYCTLKYVPQLVLPKWLQIISFMKRSFRRVSSCTRNYSFPPPSPAETFPAHTRGIASSSSITAFLVFMERFISLCLNAYAAAWEMPMSVPNVAAHVASHFPALPSYEYLTKFVSHFAQDVYYFHFSTILLKHQQMCPSFCVCVNSFPSFAFHFVRVCRSVHVSLMNSLRKTRCVVSEDS